MSKKNTRFVFHSKEAEMKNEKLRRTLVWVVIVSAILTPLLTEGVLSVVLEFISGDIAYVTFETVLRYLVVLLRFTALFASYAAVAVGLVNFGYRNFKAPLLLQILGTFVYYMVAQYGSYIFCFNHMLLSDKTYVDVYSAGFTYFFFTVYGIIKLIVLAVICIHYSRRAANEPGIYIPDETCRRTDFSSFMKTALDKKSVFKKICVFCAMFEILFSATLQFLSLTLFQLLADGAPENLAQAWILFSPYALIIPGCIFGFFLMISLCLLFSFRKPEKKL